MFNVFTYFHVNKLDFLISDKITVLNDLGVFYLQKYETEKAVEIFKKTLTLARAINDEKPNVNLALVLKNMGKTLLQSGRLDESLLYIVEAKEIMNKLLGPNHSHPLTSETIYNIGKNYFRVGDLFKARQHLKDAFKMNCEIYGENSIGGHMESVCSFLALTLKETGSYAEAMEYYTKAIKIAKKVPLTKNNCYTVIFNLHNLASTCLILEEQYEALKHLLEARKIAKETGYEDWIVVDVLVTLIKTYAKMHFIFESISCYLDARTIVRNLPKKDSLSDSISEMIKIMKIWPSP